MTAFVEIVDQGSLSGAAKTMGKSLPTLVRSLALLEEHLGVRLLNRTTRRMALTKEGTEYLERCRQILSDIGDAEEELLSATSVPRGKIRMTAPVLFGGMKVAPSLFRFLKKHVEVEVELVLLDRVVNLIDEGIDVGVRIASLGDSSQVAVRIGEVSRVVVASPDFLKAHKKPKRPEDVADSPAIVFSRDENHQPAFLFVEKGKEKRVPVSGVLKSNQAQVTIDAAKQGLGLGQFLSYQVEDDIRDGSLVPLLAKFAPPPIPVHLVFAHRRLLSARTRAVVDWLKADLA